MTKEESEQAIAMIQNIKQEAASIGQRITCRLDAIGTQIHEANAEWERHHQAFMHRLAHIEALLGGGAQ